MLTQRLQVASAPQLVIFVLTLQMTTGADKTWTRGGGKIARKASKFFFTRPPEGLGGWGKNRRGGGKFFYTHLLRKL